MNLWFNVYMKVSGFSSPPPLTLQAVLGSSGRAKDHKKMGLLPLPALPTPLLPRGDGREVPLPPSRACPPTGRAEAADDIASTGPAPAPAPAVLPKARVGPATPRGRGTRRSANYRAGPPPPPWRVH